MDFGYKFVSCPLTNKKLMFQFRHYDMHWTCTNELASLLFNILPLPRSNNNYARMILYNYLNIVCTYIISLAPVL